MTQAPTRFPLAWPAHRPRTKNRKSGPFKQQRNDTSYTSHKPIGVPAAMDRLDAELERLGAKLPILSSNVETRLDGRPRADRNPTDPGVALYFQMGGKPHTMACDTYYEVAQNIAALAAHIEATRKIERLGVATAAEVLHAFTSLPPPASAPVAKTWREVLGFTPHFPDGLSPAEAAGVVRERWKDRATAAHPDRGGTDAAMSELNAARDAALKELNA